MFCRFGLRGPLRDNATPAPGPTNSLRCVTSGISSQGPGEPTLTIRELALPVLAQVTAPVTLIVGFSVSVALALAGPFGTQDDMGLLRGSPSGS
jgi:hypothetical protein